MYKQSILDMMNLAEHCASCGALLQTEPGGSICAHCGFELEEPEDHATVLAFRKIATRTGGEFWTSDDYPQELCDEVA